MTISKERRLADQELVLALMAHELGDEALFNKWWDIDRKEFAGVLPTTWAELSEKGFVRRRQRNNPPPAYELTEAGWIVGLRLAGIFDADDFRDRCLDLVKFLKAKVKGRDLQSDAFVSHHEVHRQIPFPWVLNALRAGLLQQMFQDKRMNARWDERQKVIRVPVTFGMPE